MLKNIINSVYFYFLAPLIVAVSALFFFYNIPDDFYVGIFSYCAIIILPLLSVAYFFPLKMDLHGYFDSIQINKRYGFFIAMLCALIIVCGPFDIYVNGFKLLDTEHYADIKGIGRYIRHITTLCWIFIPVSMIYVRSSVLRGLLIAYAIIFPVLILDRNRLFLSFYSLIFCMICIYSSCITSKDINKKILYILPLVGLLIFTALGYFRSGKALVVNSSGMMLTEGSFPFKDYFSLLPAFLQQIILYITTPIFNFATIVSFDFINQDFLLSQFSPFSRDSFVGYPYSPVYVPRFNVGTEFYPFLLYGGLSWVLCAYIFMLMAFLSSVFLLKRYPNIFTLLIFFKISYSIIFMGFAPQFYLLLNLMFCVLMVSLWLFSEFVHTMRISSISGGRV